MWNSFIWPIDRVLSGATTPGQSGPGSNRKEGGSTHSPKLLHYWSLIISLFSVISRIVIVCECGGFYPSAEMRSVYSTSLANWVQQQFGDLLNIMMIIKGNRKFKFKIRLFVFHFVLMPLEKHESTSSPRSYNTRHRKTDADFQLCDYENIILYYI